ncbi:hypothetical protein HUG17_2336 [Dermatophagoides farinae]|nr:hypothetical protein HUG17_2336 [Dermatophagoides farinae]
MATNNYQSMMMTIYFGLICSSFLFTLMADASPFYGSLSDNDGGIIFTGVGGEELPRIINNNNNPDVLRKISFSSDDYLNPSMLHSGWLIPSWLIEQSLPLTSFSQIKRDLSKKHKSRDILRGLAVKRNQMIDPSSSSSSIYPSSTQTKGNKY